MAMATHTKLIAPTATLFVPRSRRTTNHQWREVLEFLDIEAARARRGTLPRRMAAINVARDDRGAAIPGRLGRRWRLYGSAGPATLTARGPHRCMTRLGPLLAKRQSIGCTRLRLGHVSESPGRLKHRPSFGSSIAGPSVRQGGRLHKVPGAPSTPRTTMPEVAQPFDAYPPPRCTLAQASNL